MIPEQPTRSPTVVRQRGWAAGVLQRRWQVRTELLAAGLANDVEIDAHLAAVDAGELDLTLAPLISAWGRRPG